MSCVRRVLGAQRGSSFRVAFASTLSVHRLQSSQSGGGAVSPVVEPRIADTTKESLTGEVERRRRTIQRATDAERAGLEVDDRVQDGVSEEERWWPPVNDKWNGHMFSSAMDKNLKRKDGMYVPEVKEMPRPDKPEVLSFADDSFFGKHGQFAMIDETYDDTKRLVPPATFDPAIDEIDDEGFNDQHVMLEILRAVDEDKKRLEAFGNPVTVEDQVDYLLQPQREGNENIAQRQEFNGFVHWGLLHAAHMVLEDNNDVKKAHELVNRYMRDVDLFVAWLKHPKVRGHIQKKFNVDVAPKFDKLMALAMCMYTRSKIQVFEDDPAGALKSLTGAMSMITEGADLKLDRHRKAIGAVLAARGMVYCKLKSYERAEEDLTRALSFVNGKRSPTLYQLRAEALEALGRIEEARQDEETAAMIWEDADVVRAGLEGEPRKYVV